ncbi:DUF4258 domain-containing protein [Longimicrobium terrae]|uniref:DUF4258 domain-containing protein n=1 Tax=Longimicrobium terrae TaxID=1639882 RepID=UPI001473A947
MIEEIRAAIAERRFELSQHASDQSVARNIGAAELTDALYSGEVIEDYPDDKYGPSCLILGLTRWGRPLHVQCSYPSRPVLKIITVYEPDPDLWIALKHRKGRIG